MHSEEIDAVVCVICTHGELWPGTTTVTLTRERMTLLVRDVPARVCDNCGEEYLDGAIATRLLGEVEQADRSGVQVAVLPFVLVSRAR